MYLHHLIDQKMYLYFFTRFLFWWKKVSQQKFQRCFNVSVRLIWRLNVGQSQIKVETTSCMSTLKLATLNVVESTSSISTSVLANNLWLHQSNIVIFNVEFHNVDQHRNKVANMTICNKVKKKVKKVKKYFWLGLKKEIEIEYAKPQTYTTISKSCWLYSWF